MRPDDLGPKELPVLKEEEEEDEEEEEEMEMVVMAAPEEKWDCETIISESLFLRFNYISVLRRSCSFPSKPNGVTPYSSPKNSNQVSW